MKRGRRKGGSLRIIPADYGIKITTYDPDFEKQIEVAKVIMRKNRDILKKLAEAVKAGTREKER